MDNPYLAQNRKPRFTTRQGSPIPGNLPAMAKTKSGNLKMSHSEPMWNDKDEFNASNKREILQSISALQRAVEGGMVQKNTATSDFKQVQSSRSQVLAEAWNDKQGQSWQVLGEVVGDEVWETLGREGFARKTLMVKPLGKGETGRLRVRRKDVISFFATSDPMVPASVARQFYVYPPEFYLLATAVVEDKEIEQAPGDILDDKYQDLLEQILVREDNVWRVLANRAAATSNDLFFFNTFTPTVFSSMRTQVNRWGIPATAAVIAFDIWDDIIADTEFSTWFDQVHKHELILEGSLGAILGVNLITDGFRFDTLRVLRAGEVYFCGAPQALGGITQRKELVMESINKYNQGRPERGWFGEAIEGMSITNSRAIVRGQRV